MCTNSWPLLLDISKDEAKRILRSIELGAYANIISAFRAQGDLTKEKCRLLLELQSVLSISTERHRAEIRRAVNDEKLSTVADKSVAGADISSEWHIEGRRLVPLMPRLVPQTAFTVTANQAANLQAEKNVDLPIPAATAFKEMPIVPMPTPSREAPHATPAPARAAPPTSPSSNVVVLPSGMAIHISGGLSDDEDTQNKRRRRSSSVEGVAPSRTHPPPSRLPPTPLSPTLPVPQATPQSPTPMKITVSKSPVRSHSSILPSSQKVIIVSSQAQTVASAANAVAASTPGYSHKPINVPVVKTSSVGIATTTVSAYPRSSFTMATAGGQTVSFASPNGNLGNIVTVATSVPHMAASAAAGQPPGVAGALQPRARVKTITARTRMPQMSGLRPGMVMPVSQQSLSHSPGGATQSIHIKPSSKPTIHIKQEGSMKIITQGSPHASKILPKPMATVGGPSVVVVTTTPPTISMARSFTATSGAQMTTGKVLNISSTGGRILATSGVRTPGANVVTVNPKTLQLTTIKGSGGTTVLTSGGRLATPSGVKPNVIVVQKAQGRKLVAANPGGAPTVQVTRLPTSSTNSPFEKEMVSFLQKQDVPTRQVLLPKGAITGDRRLIRPTGDLPRKSIVVRQKTMTGDMPSQVVSLTPGSGNRSSLLAELIQAVGIVPESGAGGEQEVSSSEESRAVAALMHGESSRDTNQWVDYDVQPDSTSGDSGGRIEIDSTDSSAIKALLDLQSGAGTSRPQLNISRPGSVEMVGSAGTPRAVTVSNVATVSRVVAPQRSQPSTVQIVDQSGHTVRVHLAGGDQGAPEVLGELDPSTGILYAPSAGSTGLKRVGHIRQVTAAPAMEERPEVASGEIICINSDDSSVESRGETVGVTGVEAGTRLEQVTMVMTGNTAQEVQGHVEGQEAGDFLTSVLNQAQIDLDPYQFIGGEDGGGSMSTVGETVIVTEVDDPTPPVDNIVIVREPMVVGEAARRLSLGSEPPVEQAATTVTLSTQSAGLVSILNPVRGTTAEPRSTVIPSSGQVAKTISSQVNEGIITLATKTIPSVISIATSGVEEEVESEGTSYLIGQPGVAQPPVSNIPVVSQLTGNVTVATQPGMLEQNQLVLEDLTSQQQQQQQQQHGDADAGSGAEDGSYSPNPTDGSPSAEHMIRLSKRKRKPPASPDEITGRTVMIGWTRQAIELLQKVCRFRGAYKEKGEINAASWFTRPVDSKEVPDYYTVIKQPMDFSTIRKRLENGHYTDWNGFHTDMLLVRENCVSYNSPNTIVRRDCEQVFQYYQGEFDKVVRSWQQGHSPSPASKRLKFDRPGVLS